MRKHTWPTFVIIRNECGIVCSCVCLPSVRPRQRLTDGPLADRSLRWKIIVLGNKQVNKWAKPEHTHSSVLHTFTFTFLMVNQGTPFWSFPSYLVTKVTMQHVYLVHCYVNCYHCIVKVWPLHQPELPSRSPSYLFRQQNNGWLWSRCSTRRQLGTQSTLNVCLCLADKTWSLKDHNLSAILTR